MLGIAWSDVDAKYRALMPNSGLAPNSIEESLDLIHRFRQVVNVSRLTLLLGSSTMSRKEATSRV